ncbi:hypothetical protein [Entomobacter blattae]|uniref:Uncharacterized protein n=1 Tax=Entomobacter blattae TaxID=2762277 RepID=A0A7H1NRW5_9PROT|nr:hypothetical protein [Entomobacter blattae]QNT78525.1 hypothetical protein JGUZn3_12990 [Entomobacter blattae]
MRKIWQLSWGMQGRFAQASIVQKTSIMQNQHCVSQYYVKQHCVKLEKHSMSFLKIHSSIICSSCCCAEHNNPLH